MLSWEAVLAEVEADLERSARLAAERPDTPLRLTAADLLPPPTLPDLATMPDIPPELRNRVRALRDRADALRRELAATMAEVATHLRPLQPRTGYASVPATPQFVDRVV